MWCQKHSYLFISFCPLSSASINVATLIFKEIPLGFFLCVTVQNPTAQIYECMILAVRRQDTGRQLRTQTPIYHCISAPFDKADLKAQYAQPGTVSHSNASTDNTQTVCLLSLMVLCHQLLTSSEIPPLPSQQAFPTINTPLLKLRQKQHYKQESLLSLACSGPA